MFDSIASGYDAFNHITSLGIDRCWRRRALRHINGPKVLDLACGTGDFSIAISKHLKGSAVVGADISTGMLAVMEQKIKAAGLEPSAFSPDGTPLNGISTLVAEAGNLPFQSDTFNSVTVAFGVRNFSDREKCLREALRVLTHGGHFVMLELSMPSAPLVRGLFKFYFTRIMPLIGNKISHNKAAYMYLPASVLQFPKKHEWMATMQEAGFKNVRHYALSLGICRLYIGEK